MGPKERMRSPGVDSLRGVAVLAMAAYHVPYLADVREGFATAHRTAFEPLGTFARTTFLCLSGFVPPSARPWHRAARLAAGALLMTAWTRCVFPRFYVRFGVLHFLAVAGLLVQLVVDPLVGDSAELMLGLAVASHWTFQQVQHRGLPGFPAYALGCGAHTHHAMDYFPVLKNVWMVLVGRVAASSLSGAASSSSLSASLTGYETLKWLGRNSLEVYVAHWPVALALSSCF